jgi:hypothetical protein
MLGVKSVLYSLGMFGIEIDPSMSIWSLSCYLEFWLGE